MPKRPRSHVLEDLSRIRLHEAFEKEGWTVEDLAKDYGEDLLVRIFENGQATPYSFFVQAKSSDHIEKYFSSDTRYIKLAVELGHVRHWIRFLEPVILTIWDSCSDTTYWACVQRHLGEKAKLSSRRKTIQIAIPRRNTLDDDGLKRIRGVTKLRFGRPRRHSEAVAILMELLKKAGKTITEFDPDGGLIKVKLPGGGSELMFFGPLWAELEELSRRLGRPPKDLLIEGMNLLDEEISNPNWKREDSDERSEKMFDQDERDAADED
jgi:hypothetical protein